MIQPPSWALTAAHVARYVGLRSNQPLRRLKPHAEHLSQRLQRLDVAWQHSRLSNSDAAQNDIALALEMATETTGRFDATDNLVEALTALGNDLAIQNRQSFDFPDIDLSRSLTAAEARFVSLELSDIETRLANDERIRDLFLDGIDHIYRVLLRALPDRSGDGDTAAQFTVPLYALLDTKDLITFFINCILRDLQPETPDAVAELAFARTRDQLWDNFLAVSNLTPAAFEKAPHKLCWPEDSDLPPPAMIRAYMGDTPLAELTATPMPFSLPHEARFEHCHIVGGSGHGKTQLLQHLIHGDLQAARSGGPSVVIIDSQGDLIRTVSNLALFDPDAENSVAGKFMLIDPNDIAYPAALNMFDVNMDRVNAFPALEREKILNGTIELYEYIFGALLGAELTQKQGLIFRYLARLMMVIPGANIQTLRELLEDGARFKPHFAQLEGSARHFFETEYLSKSFAATKTQALRRLWGVLSNPTFERMFSHQENKVDLFAAMNAGKIIMIITAKDLLKQEGCEIFGRFFIAMIAQAALQRAAIAEDERRDTFVYIDEAHDYFDDNIENLLNQARKYRVGLTLAHQNLDQLSAGLRASMMSSTAIKFVGGLSAKDAKTLAPDMHTSSEFLQAMRKSGGQTNFACYVRNQTETALELSVPLGMVNELPTIDEDTFAALLDDNRTRYAAPLDSLGAQPSEPGQPDQPPDDQESATAAIGTGHRDLQQLLKQTAQHYGHSVDIEYSVLEGTGSVDVAITTTGRTIACEISATTRPDHELQNARKCLAAGFTEVWMIAEDVIHLVKLSEHLTASLQPFELASVKFLSREAALRAIEELPRANPAIRSRAFGYDIEIQLKPQSAEQKAQRRHALAQLLT
ncbi:MAG: type IV secretion system DNA-binding domain-containing protein [Pseudomonadota bacterium]